MCVPLEMWGCFYQQIADQHICELKICGTWQTALDSGIFHKTWLEWGRPGQTHTFQALIHSLRNCNKNFSFTESRCPTFSGRQGRGWRSPPQSPSPRPPPSCLLLTEFHRVERVEGGETRQVRTTRRCCWAATSFELGLISPELRHRLIYGFLSVCPFC